MFRNKVKNLVAIFSLKVFAMYSTLSKIGSGGLEIWPETAFCRSKKNIPAIATNGNE